MLVGRCLLVLCGAVRFGDGAPTALSGEVSLAMRFGQLQETLQEHMGSCLKWGEAAQLMIETVLPEAEKAYSSILRVYLLEGHAATAERRMVAQVLRNIAIQRQDDLSLSCGGDRTEEAIRRRFGVAHSLTELLYIAREIMAIGKLSSVVGQLSEQQGEWLHECIMAKYNLLKQIRIAFLMTGGSPEGAPSLVLSVEPKNDKAMLDNCERSLAEGRETFLASLARLCDSFQEVTSQPVFDHLYTLLLKD